MSKKCAKGKSRDAELERQGWIRRFVTDEPRLSEAVELYESIGYEVRLEPAVFDETSEECKNACYIKIVTNAKPFTQDPKKEVKRKRRLFLKL